MEHPWTSSRPPAACSSATASSPTRRAASTRRPRCRRTRGTCARCRGRIGDKFEAIVTGVVAGAIYVRLCAPPVAEDNGDRLRVKLRATDPARGFVDFARVP